MSRKTQKTCGNFRAKSDLYPGSCPLRSRRGQCEVYPVSEPARSPLHFSAERPHKDPLMLALDASLAKRGLSD